MQSLSAPIVLAIAALPASGAVFQYCAGVATDKAPGEAFLRFPPHAKRIRGVEPPVRTAAPVEQTVRIEKP